MGLPGVPPPGSPGGPPALPGEDPYDLDRYGKIDSSRDWQLWWSFNRDRFLRYTNIQTGLTYTGSDGFYLGSGQELEVAVGGRASDALVDGVLSDSLLEGMKKGGSNEFCRSALVAMAKIGGPNKEKFDWVNQWFVSNGTPEMVPTSAFIAGMTGGKDQVQLLSDIALSTKAGCEAVTAEGKPRSARVPMSVRAFACYGLGMIGSRTTDFGVRSDIVKTLVEILENDSAEANDARVAAMISLGLVPLAVDQDVVACYCGTCVVPDPHTSLRPQVTYLMRYFTAAKEFDPTLRAHAATTLGRLVAARPDGMSERMKEGVAEVLVRALEKTSRQPAEVRESSVLALGLIGDADNDNLDLWIRWAIKRSLRNGGDMEKRFALISLGEIGGHKGQGDEPWAGLADVRSVLTKQMGSAEKRMKPWAGLALGVMGHELRAKGQELDPMVDSAIGNAVRASKKLDDLGAYALAVGLRKNSQEAERLVKKLERSKDEATKGYLAIALGMMGAKDATESLQGTLEFAKGQPLLQIRAGTALGMLGDATVAEQLLELIDEARLARIAAKEAEGGDSRRRKRPNGSDDGETEATMIAAIQALGYIGDSRGVDALAKMVVDEDELYSIPIREAAVVALGFMGDRTRRPWRTALTLGANYCAPTKTLTSASGDGVLDLK